MERKLHPTPNFEIKIDSKIADLERFLNENPDFIHEIEPVSIICFPTMGVFKLYFIAGKYRICKDEKVIFSSGNCEIVRRNLKEWYHYSKKERDGTHLPKTNLSLDAVEV